MDKYFLVIYFLIIYTLLICQNFIEKDVPFEGIASGDSEWGDYDNDGDLDIIISGRTVDNSGSTKIYNNDGYSSFSYSGIILNNYAFSSVDWGDFDNDGDLDIIVTGSYQSTIYENIDGAAFEALDIALQGVIEGDSKWGDYDNDGDLDLAIIGTKNSDYFSIIYRNDGNGSFVDINTGFEGVWRGSIDWGDFDGDSDLDILICGRLTYPGGGNITKLYRNIGNDTFEETQNSFAQIHNGEASFADYDNDGDLDILVVGSQNNNSEITKLYNLNDFGEYEEVESSIPDMIFCDTNWGDYDNDGDLDILICGSLSYGGEPHTYIINNNGDGSFTNSNIQLHGVKYNGVRWADFDSDKDLDILLVGFDNNGQYVSKLYQNNGDFSPNNLPSTPTNLNKGISDNSVELYWSPAQDSETPSQSLTYNIVVGTESGGVQIVSPMSHVINGTLKIPKSGNAGHNTEFILQGLNDGEYFWRVQTIDTSFGSSSFSNEHTFRLPEIDSVVYGNFYASVSTNGINLLWDTISEYNNLRFEIERKITTDGVWENIGFVNGLGNSNEIQSYNFFDDDLVSGSYQYRLKQIEIGNDYSYSTIVCAILPILLESFEITTINNEVKLIWITSSEFENKSFDIERKDHGSDDWDSIATINGNGTNNSLKIYNFVDKELSLGSYNYRLKHITYSGNFNYSEIKEAVITIPNYSTLYQNYPNPFNSETTIKFHLSEQSDVELILYNIKGQKVMPLVNEQKPAGYHYVKWKRGNLSSGVYFYSLKANSYTKKKKMIIIY